MLFGFAHALGFSDGRFDFDPITMLLTAAPSLLGVWLVLRTRGVLLPVLMHNFGNVSMLLTSTRKTSEKCQRIPFRACW